MRIQNFEEVISWQDGRELFIELIADFIDVKNLSFKDQLLRAALSIVNNIAEGFGRGSDKESRKFIYIARGVSTEVRSMPYIAPDAEYIDEKQHKHHKERTIKISKLLTGFINKLTTSDERRATDRPKADQ